MVTWSYLVLYKQSDHVLAQLVIIDKLEQQQMDALYSEEELSTIQSKIWWVACNITPFLIRSATIGSTILLNITDLRSLWGTRVDEKKLLKDKEIYAKTLEVSSSRELVSLFQGILSNPEQKALYKFIKKNTGDLTFEIEKEIEVYPLTWRFELLQLDCDISNMMCKDIINPLTRTLNAQEKRIEIMRRKMKMLEENLLKRMTEAEKAYYKSALNQDEEDLKLLLRPPKEQEFITELHMENRSKFFFQLALSGQRTLKVGEKINPKQRGEKATKVQKRVAGFNDKLNAEQIINELQMKKQQQRDKKKKKKNLDFI